MPGGDQVVPRPHRSSKEDAMRALTSDAMVRHTDVLYTAHALSAVVQAIVHLEPILQFMPAKCSADVQAIIEHVDAVLLSNNTADMKNLKTIFGLQGLAHNDDFAAPLQQHLLLWQCLELDNGPGEDFDKFCDAFEVKNG
ncbi:hypothetical protein C8Q76DRAFT_195574 [Earliella scabrosa]|nr:hypothetical protein C8Q76DRAFT_195574 [Earliella scabrosa]